MMKWLAAFALLTSMSMQAAFCTTIKISYKSSVIVDADTHSPTRDAAHLLSSEAASFKSKCLNGFVEVVMVGEVFNSSLKGDEVHEPTKSTLAVAQLLFAIGFEERSIFQYQLSKAKSDRMGISHKTTNKSQHQVEVEMVCTPGPNRSANP